MKNIRVALCFLLQVMRLAIPLRSNASSLKYLPLDCDARTTNSYDTIGYYALQSSIVEMH